MTVRALAQRLREGCLSAGVDAQPPAGAAHPRGVEREQQTATYETARRAWCDLARDVQAAITAHAQAETQAEGAVHARTTGSRTGRGPAQLAPLDARHMVCSRLIASSASATSCAQEFSSAEVNRS
ncbi:hypothetical protein JCM12681A_73850 [Streptomyces mexicanus]